MAMMMMKQKKYKEVKSSERARAMFPVLMSGGKAGFMQLPLAVNTMDRSLKTTRQINTLEIKNKILELPAEINIAGGAKAREFISKNHGIPMSYLENLPETVSATTDTIIDALGIRKSLKLNMIIT